MSRSGVAPRRPPLGTNAWRVIAARFISRAGSEAGFFVGVWGTAAYDLDATPTSLSLLMIALGLAMLVGSAAGGVLVDRIGPKRVLLASELVFVPGILLLMTVDSMGELTLLAPIAWFAGAFTMTAVTSFPPYLTDDRNAIERVNVTMEGASTGAFVLGPALGAFVSQLVSLDVVFAFDALTSLVAVGLVVPVTLRSIPREADDDGGTGSLAELRAGFRHAYRRPPIRLLLVIGSMTWLSFGAFTALEPLFYRDVLGTGPEALGYVNAVFGAGLLAGTLTLNRYPGRFTHLRAVIVLTAAGGLGAVLYTGTASLTVVVLGGIYWGFVLGILMPLLRTLTHLYTRPAFIGRVMGVFGVHHQVGEMLPLAFAPALAGAFGVQRVLIGTGVLLILLAPTGWLAARRLDATEEHRGEPPAPALGDLEEHVAPVVP